MYTVEAMFFPTKIILVDDSQDFLKAISQHLSKYFQVETYNDPHQALNYIRKSQSNMTLLEPTTLIVEEDQSSGETKIDLDKLQNFVGNKDKYNLLTIIISDYEMPEMNGIQFFEHLHQIPAMKILLTGKADLQLALDAFNRGLVNRFLIKNTEKMLEEIIMNIQTCQHLFFEKKSYPILSQISVPCDSLLNKPNFAYHFTSLIREYDISEYYLMDVIGSFLLITKKGNKKYLICMIEKQFNEYLNIAEMAGVSSEMTNKIKNRQQAPVFLSEDDYKLSAKNWESISYPFEKKDEYYFCLIQNSKKEKH